MLPLALSIGILAGIWTFASGSFQILTWPAFVGWALFFAAGGDNESVKKVLGPGLLGMVLGLAVVKGAALIPGAWFVAVGVTVIAIIMVMVMPVKLFSFTPAAFAGCAVYFGANGDIVAAVIPFVFGTVLGWVSAVLPKYFQKPNLE
ncbi:DUF1097 domain-containing protein [Thermincola potens]|uniref:DUF1097 domain-containing protein n=1 Tax=Thermincola potens (strain JR) TaxID=635013 RepID=D5XBT7_THEPJ|nr:DUF1097 domain-containing protein [Thermincola potens]ADG81485.1 protein of unknown function DUF1097 [Thermincola potens JR]